MNPSVADGYRRTLVAPFVEILPPLGALAILPSLRDAGADARLLDLNLARDPKLALSRALESVQPTIVGFSILTPQAPAVRGLVRAVRRERPAARIWGGGVHPTIFPRESIYDLDLDGAVVGEGDFVFAEGLSARDRGRVAGIVSREGGEILAGPPAEPIRDLDCLPVPAWEAVRPADYARGMPLPLRRRRIPGPIETSRGCVLRCAFCTKAVHGNRFRAKSPARVVSEMRRLRDLGFGEAHVLDDCFNTSVRRAREICDRLVAGGIGLPWNCRVGIRPDRVDAALLAGMRAAGCYRVSLGIESASQAVLDDAGKNMRVEDGVRAVRLASEAGIETMAFFVLGLPADTPETIAATIAHAKLLRPTFAKFALFTPLPSTPAHEKLAREGRLSIRSWEDLSFHRLPPRTFHHPNLSPRQLLRAYLEAYASFYLGGRGWLGRLRSWLTAYPPSGARFS